MKKTILTIIFLAIFILASFTQTKDDTIQQLKTGIEKLENTNIKLSGQLNTANTNIQKIEKKLSATTDSLNILKNNLANTNSNLKQIADKLGLQIQQTNDKTNADLTILSQKVSKNTLYWIIAVLLIALLSVLLFSWLKNQLSIEKTGLSDQIMKTSEILRDEQLKLDGQLIKLLDTQMQLMKEERQKSIAKPEEIDHSLVLKVADRLISIEKNLNQMDKNTRGLKNLWHGINNIRDNFAASGYEIVDMLNKPFDQGMKVSANFRPDENLKKEEQVITRIIRPQVNFRGVMIQAAEVEVSVGE